MPDLTQLDIGQQRGITIARALTEAQLAAAREISIATGSSSVELMSALITAMALNYATVNRPVR